MQKNKTTISFGRREAVITERAGKFKIEFFLLFDDDPSLRENVGGDLKTSRQAAEQRARSWVHGAST